MQSHILKMTSVLSLLFTYPGLAKKSEEEKLFLPSVRGLKTFFNPLKAFIFKKPLHLSLCLFLLNHFLDYCRLYIVPTKSCKDLAPFTITVSVSDSVTVRFDFS